MKKIDFKNFKQSRAVRTGAFLLAFVMIFCSLSSFVFTTKNGAHYKSKYYPQYAFQDERKNSLQILGIGNSNLYSAFDVPDLWHDYGYTASMAAVGFQSPSVSYQLLKKAYETQKPKIVLIETDILYDEKPIQSHGVTPKTTVFDYFKTEFIDDKLQSVFPILKFHDMWKKPIDNKYNIDTPDSHGFKYDSRNGKYNVPNYMAKTDRTEDVSEINIYYLEKILTLCRENGSEPLLISVPSLTSWDYARHNSMTALAKKENVDYIDFNMLTAQLKIDLSKSFRDNGTHMNYTGAKKVTDYLGAYIAENYSLADLRGDKSYSYWDDSYNNFVAQMKQTDEKQREKALEMKRKGFNTQGRNRSHSDTPRNK